MATESTPKGHLLGRSLELDAGDLVVIPGPPPSLAMVEDEVALRQAMVLAIQTQLGSDPVNAQYGFDQTAIGVSNYGLRTRKDYIRLQLVRAIGSDRRVKDIKEIYFDDDPRFFELNPDIDRETYTRKVHAERNFRVTVVIETIGGKVVDAGVVALLG